ncbi:DUF3775 domain-containing protein [Pelagibius sp. 7325]|uniref:DUF3775 domain-containing protein n=1 Tax=Pelagibius sp. 7325 TaxID=3131994 RepID=UPI0030ED2126
MVARQEADPDTPEIALEIDPGTVAFLIAKARAFDAKVAPADRDEISQPGEDEDHDALEDYGDDPVAEEIAAVINELNVDEQVELVAMTWIGRGDFAVEEWEEALEAARERRVGSTSKYLLGMPLLGDMLEEGFVALGYTLEDYEIPV